MKGALYPKIKGFNWLKTILQKREELPTIKTTKELVAQKTHQRHCSS